MTTFKTGAEALHWASQQLAAAGLCFGHGYASAADEAVQIIAHVLQTDDDRCLRQPLKVADAEKIQAIVKQRIETRQPLAYLLHQVWFMGLSFYVDERVLIPRSPFAEWIVEQFCPWIIEDQVQRILEIGTGSGCMAILAAMAFPKASVDAVDISADALAVATRNVQQYELTEQVQLIQSDCFAALAGRQYDIIMSNPPYVGHEEMQTLPKEYSYEPRLALEANDEGFAIVLQIMREAPTYMTPHAILVIEVGYGAERLQERLPQVPFMWLDQALGGQGLFMLTRTQLVELEL